MKESDLKLLQKLVCELSDEALQKDDDDRESQSMVDCCWFIIEHAMKYKT